MAICSEYVFEVALRDSQDDLGSHAVIVASSYQQVAWIILGVIQNYLWKRIYLVLLDISQIFIDLRDPKLYACFANHCYLFTTKAELIVRLWLLLVSMLLSNKIFDQFSNLSISRSIKCFKKNIIWISLVRSNHLELALTVSRAENHSSLRILLHRNSSSP